MDVFQGYDIYTFDEALMGSYYTYWPTFSCSFTYNIRVFCKYAYNERPLCYVCQQPIEMPFPLKSILQCDIYRQLSNISAPNPQIHLFFVLFAVVFAQSVEARY